MFSVVTREDYIEILNEAKIKPPIALLRTSVLASTIVCGRGAFPELGECRERTVPSQVLKALVNEVYSMGI